MPIRIFTGVFRTNPAGGLATKATRHLDDASRDRLGIDYPFILKPDIGQRGAGSQGEMIVSDDRWRQARHLLGLTSTAHAWIASLREDAPATLDYARQALSCLAITEYRWDIPWRSTALIAMSAAHLSLGDPEAAVADLVEAIELGKSYDHHFLVITAMSKQAMAYWRQGRLRQAARVCRQGLQYIERRQLARLPVVDALLIAWGFILGERGELETAATYLQRGLELSRLGRHILTEYWALQAWIRLWLAKGDLQSAERYVHQADELARRHDIPLWLEADVAGLIRALMLGIRARESGEIIALVQPRLEIFGALLGLGILLVLLVAGLEALVRGRGRSAFGLLWFPLTILPVSNLLFPIGVIVAERTLYLPLLAVCLGVAMVVERIGARGRVAQRAFAVAGVGALVLLAARTVTRIPIWDTTDRVFYALEADRPNSFRAAWHLARVAKHQHKDSLELTRYRKAVALWPYRRYLVTEALTETERLGEVADARALAAFAVARWPDSPLAHRYLASTALAMGDTASARAAARAGLQVAPADTGLLRVWRSVGGGRIR